MDLTDNDIKARIRRFRAHASLEMHERTLRDALAAQSAARATGSQQRRRSMMKRTIKLAAAVVVAAGITTLAITMFENTATVAFAQVREQILKAQSGTWRMTIAITQPTGQPPGRPETMEAQCYFKEPGRTRMVQSQEGKVVNIITVDLQRGRSLTLQPSQKRAVVFDLGDLRNTKAFSVVGNPTVALFNKLKEAVRGAEEALGEKVIDGRQALGFRVGLRDSPGMEEVDVWVDARTAEILLIQYSVSRLQGRAHEHVRQSN
jgi:hypothetical protein